MTPAEQRVRALPIWQGLKDLVPLKGGVSNASFTVTDATGRYVARVGEDYPFHQVSRERETIASRAAYEAGLSPEVVHTAPGIMVVRYLDARTYAEADVRANAAPASRSSSAAIARWARRITGQGAIFWVFQILRDYAHTLKAGKHRHVPDLPRLHGHPATIWRRRRCRCRSSSVITTCCPPISWTTDTRLWLIDWEYGAFGTAMFDLANIASNNSFDAAGERVILETYFEKRPPPSIERAFYAMKAASAMREAVWGMVSELHLNAPGVDYVAYAAEYLGRFETVYAAYLSNFGKS